MAKEIRCQFCNEPIGPGDFEMNNVYEDLSGGFWHYECYEEEFGETPPLNEPPKKTEPR